MNILEEKSERNRFERKLDEYNHTMEFIRTIVPIAVLVIQVVILVNYSKLLNIHIYIYI